MKPKEERIVSIDLLRSFAILTVVLCHSTETIYPLNVDGFSQLCILSQIFALTTFTIGRLGVPIFIFISGYLLLPRQYDRVRCMKFWKKNWLGLLITTEIWIVFYNIFLTLFYNRSFNWDLLLENMLFFKQVALSHMWYMPMIIGMYIFIPLVANVLQNIEHNILVFPMLISGIIIFVLPVINVIITASGGEQIHSLLTIDFSGGVYGYILILGFLVRKGVLKSVNGKILCIVGTSLFVGTILLQLYAYGHSYGYNVWYDCGTLVACSVIIFELGTRLERFPFDKLIRVLARCSFGIFLIHNLIIQLIQEKF